LPKASVPPSPTKVAEKMRSGSAFCAGAYSHAPLVWSLAQNSAR
jgi:hypothetical protein